MLLFETKFGSQVYGTAIPTSDIDIGKVSLETPTQIFGIQKEEVLSQKIENGQDTRELLLRRFCKLCMAGNPNVLEWLYSPKEAISYIDLVFEELIWKNRSLFLVKDAVINSHIGFAKSQIIKMRKHEQEMGAKRKELYAKFGYDVKYASHAIRLLHQLGDIFSFGEIRLPYDKEFAELLKYIKQGGMNLGQFDVMYEVTLKKVEKQVQDSKISLREKPDFDKLAEILEAFYLNKFYNIPLGAEICI